MRSQICLFVKKRGRKKGGGRMKRIELTKGVEITFPSFSLDGELRTSLVFLAVS